MFFYLSLLSLFWLAYLALESHSAAKARHSLPHIVHVNGTRGKSSVSRLIEAGLREGGLSVFCKTTGTLPMTIDVNGSETPIRRRGKPNIKEQLGIMRKAADQGAQVLVVECMAVQPELQYAAQHRILQADIGVITNVRRDHTDVMGKSLEEIAVSLSSTVPKSGVLFTAEDRMDHILRKKADSLGCEWHQVLPTGTEPDFDFPDNIALALSVCRHLGVPDATALCGMAHYRRDPYALSIYRIGAQLWINGLSINDPESIRLVYRRLDDRLRLGRRPLVLLINNRFDRSSRTQDMLGVCRELAPTHVLLTGASLGYMKWGLSRQLPRAEVTVLRPRQPLPTDILPENAVVYCIGNLAQGGLELIEAMKKEGEEFVP